eukprot:1890224-Pleurochrysis_carterae.AAC.4
MPAPDDAHQRRLARAVCAEKHAASAAWQRHAHIAQLKLQTFKAFTTKRLGTVQKLRFIPLHS